MSLTTIRCGHNIPHDYYIRSFDFEKGDAQTLLMKSRNGKQVLRDLHHRKGNIVLDLHDERFNELVVEVGDPEVAVKPIRDAK